MSTTQPAAAPELRRALAPIEGLEWRDANGTGDGSYTLTGYAAVYDEETVLYDGSFWRLREKIARGAFTDVLSRADTDVHLVIGHNMDLPMARTGIDGVGGLELSEDERGLRVFARLDPEISYIRDLGRLMRVPAGGRAVVDQMSFAFTVAEDVREITTDDEGHEDELRTITRIGELYDVTVTPQGAYAQTSATLRSLAAALGRAGSDPAGHTGSVAPAQPAGDHAPVAPAQPVGGVPSPRLAAARLRARALRMAHPTRST